MKRTVHAVAWVVLAVSAFLLWPDRWGGSMTYVITTGSSMAPTWEAGDLAVLREADDYAVGDVAAFRSDKLQQIVMHRIVEEQDGVYRFQGDDNDFVDPDEVTQEQMVGELVLRVPKVGLFLAWLTKPVNLIIAAAALFLLFADRRDRRAERTASLPEPPAAPRAPLFVHVDAVDVPPSAAVADLVCSAELRDLAMRYDRPVLHDQSTRTLYVFDGQVVYRCASAGRLAARPPAAVPPPRHASDGDVVRQLFGP